MSTGLGYDITSEDVYSCSGDLEEKDKTHPAAIPPIHDLGELRLTHRYDPEKLNAKFPWYRSNSNDDLITTTKHHEDTETSFEVPQELRPLGFRRRYMRTIQLIPDSDEDAIYKNRLSDNQDIDVVDPLAQSNFKLVKSASLANVLPGKIPERRIRKQNAEKQTTIGERGRKKGDDKPSHLIKDKKLRTTTSTRAILLAKTRSRGSCHNLEQLPNISRQLQLSDNPLESIDKSDLNEYVGAHAKAQFFTKYHHLHSRSSLFVETTSQEETGVGNAFKPMQEQNTSNRSIPSQKKSFIATLPSSPSVDQQSNSCRVNVAPLPSNYGTEDLSPRSVYLSNCVANGNLALPFLLRRRMTKVFDFSYQSLGDDFIKDFALCLGLKMPVVEEIIVRDNRLTDTGLNTLLEAISRGSSSLYLRRLDISQNTIGEKSAQTLRSYIVSPTCTLQELIVDNADIDDRECAAFMSAFEENATISQLGMSHNSIGKSEHLNVVKPSFTTGGEAIAAMLRMNKVMTHLDISWNFLRLESSIELARSVLLNGTLVKLQLAYNACGDAGAMTFGKALQTNKQLRVLDLSYNGIGSKGAMVLATALRSNHTLSSLQMNGNNIGREGGQALLLALSANRTDEPFELGLHACNFGSTNVHIDSGNTSKRPANAVSSRHTGRSQTASASDAKNEFDVSEFPVYTTQSGMLFNAKEPTGHYILELDDAYGHMILMELMRLARYKKGCRFLRIEHQLPGRKGGKPIKRIVDIIRVESEAVLRNSFSTGKNSSLKHVSSQLEDHGLDSLFEGIDQDHSGSLDFDEIKYAFNRIGLFPQDEYLHNVVNQVDLDHSSSLDAGEFAFFFLRTVFQLMDTDGSGKIDASELAQVYQSLGIATYREGEVADAIAQFDINGDGEMEEVEFIEFMTDRLLETIKIQLFGDDDTDKSKVDERDTVDVMLLDASTQRPWEVPEEGILLVDFVYEREAFETNEDAYQWSKVPSKGFQQLMHNLLNPSHTKSERDDLFQVAIYDSDLRFTAPQAHELLQSCGYLKSEDKMLESVGLMLPQMLTTRDAQLLVSQTLTLRQRYRLKAHLGCSYSIFLGNPTARYVIDLSKPKDRMALCKLAEVAQCEKLFSRHRSNRMDTSQHGNWENFRNEKLDGQPIALTQAFFCVLPRRGRLCFDYVSTSRPKKGKEPLSTRRFQQLIRALETDLDLVLTPGDTSRSSLFTRNDEQQGKQPRLSPCNSVDSLQDHLTVANDAPEDVETWNTSALSGNEDRNDLSNDIRTSVSQDRLSELSPRALQAEETPVPVPSLVFGKAEVGLKLVQIEAAMCDRWVTCAQAKEIVECLPTTHFQARAEATRILFSRIIDLDNFYQLYDSLETVDQAKIAKTLGWLNIMNPMMPDRRYRLDLSVWDERELAKLLVVLAIAEPGENWLDQYFAHTKEDAGVPGWKLPTRWEQEDPKDSASGVNRSGYLELTYYSGHDRGCAPIQSLRKSLMERTLCGTRLYYL